MILGAIDIGSHATKLKIVEYKKEKYKTLEEIIYPLSLGKSVFESKKIDAKHRDALIKCLKHFQSLMIDYGVEHYRALATGVFRNARNGQIVIELILRQINLKVEIVEESIERFLTYISLKDILPDYFEMRRQGMLLIEVGSSSSEIIVYNNNKMMRNYEIHIGTLSMKELIYNIRRDSLNVPQILEDYIYASTENLQNYLIRKKMRHFVILGTHIKRLHQLFGDKPKGFSAACFNEIVDKLNTRDKGLKKTLEREGLNYDEILSSMTIYSQFVKHTEADFISVPDVNLRDGILRSLVENTFDYDRKVVFTQDILKAAKQIAKRHHSTASHINQVDKFVVKIFDAFKKEEKLSEKDLLLMRLVSILHETGKFSKQVNYNQATYHAILNASLLGVSQDMLYQAAQISNYFFYFSQGSEIVNRSYKTSTKNIKLGLLIALADALDKSKLAHITIKNIKLEKKHLRIVIKKQSNAFFEKWTVRALNQHFSEILARDVVLEEHAS
ncbi:MAG: hypothetical protein CSB19_01130 [Clostridiales bacterium]|nr:MAG: hypothetical protein CSB19_01130 [Clostridiales bacterium]